MTSGLSGTSFTGYPLPDVAAAGINLKNQVKLVNLEKLAVPYNTCRVKFSRKICLVKSLPPDGISANGCQALMRYN